MASCKFFFNRYLLWAGFIFYLLFAFFIKNPMPDVHLFESAGFYLTQKNSIYFIDQTHGTYPFFPFLIFPYALFHLVVKRYPILPFSFLVKLILIPTIFALGILIEKLSILQGLKKNSAFQRKILFCLNPVVFFSIVYHGQADILLLFFFLLSFYFFEKTLLSGIFYGLSILTKTWSVIFWPLFFLKIKTFNSKIIHFLSTIIPIFVVCFIYTRLVGSSFRQVASAVFGHPAVFGQHSGTPSFWGIAAILNVFFQVTKNTDIKYFIQHFSSFSTFILAIVFLLLYLIIFIKKISFHKSSLILILGFYILTPSWGIQYSLWVLPFLFMENLVYGLVYSFIASPYLIFSYLPVINSEVDMNLSKLFSLLPWLFSLVIFYQLIKNVIQNKN